MGAEQATSPVGRIGCWKFPVSQPATVWYPLVNPHLLWSSHPVLIRS